MSRGSLRGTFWPTALQERLLVVALGQPSVAAAAWQELRPRFSLDELERGSFELLPLVYRNLTFAGIDDSLVSRLKGVYRKTWVANNLLVERTGETAETLSKAGIPALFVEGVVIATRFYPELGLRPTSSLDVLVDDLHASAALARLTRAGWRIRPGSSPAPGEIGHLLDGRGSVCALRTRLAVDFVPYAAARRSPAPPWDGPDRLDLAGTELLTPTATDSLVAVCVSHARAGGGSSTQWIADAKMLLGGEIDWGRLVVLCAEHGQSARLRDALRYLVALPGPVPPKRIVDQLTETRITPRERLSYRCTSGSIRGLGSLPQHVAEHLAATAREPLRRAVATFPRHLRDRWQLSGTWQVPFAALRRGLRLARTRGGAD